MDWQKKRHRSGQAVAHNAAKCIFDAFRRLLCTSGMFVRSYCIAVRLANRQDNFGRKSGYQDIVD